MWERTLWIGEVYEGRGKLGISKEGISKELEGMYDFVWHHDLQKDIDTGIRQLQERGAFSQV